MHSRTPGRSVSRRGVAVVEFVILLPFLSALVVGLVEIGRAITVRQVLNDAVRKGCRTGAEPNRTTSDITADITNVLTDNNITVAPTVTVLVNGANADASTAVRKAKQLLAARRAAIGV